ncbi:matrix metalloproteinase-18-like [Pelodytes ibericus]
MDKRPVLFNSEVLLLLLIFPFGSSRPIFEENDGAEINAPPIYQPRGIKPETTIQIEAELFKLAADYLIDFGYLPDENLTEYAVPNTAFISEDELPEEFISGLEWFQRQNGLKVTGRLDADTAEAMHLPRCGKHEQRMSFNLGSKWKKDSLTYKIINTTSLLADKLVREELIKALKVWENVSHLKFIEVGINQTADIDIFFVSGLHNDGFRNAFDGPGRVLGHAFMPPSSKSKKDIDGDLHLDNDEKWSINQKKGINLLQAAAHEIGHSLGLDHSTVPEALMAPTYKGYKPNFQLHQDDIEAIQSMYGKPSAQVKPSSPLPTKASNSKVPTTGGGKTNVSKPSVKDTAKKQSVISVCGDEPIDTFVSTKDGSIFLFKGQYYWEVTHGSFPLTPKKKVPQLISTKWKELPDSIDASIRMQNPTAEQDGKTFFFKGTRYWKYDGDRMEPGYPKLIKEGFPGVPANLDAAFTQPAIVIKGGKVIREERIFFIKGKNFILYDPVSGNSTAPQSLEENWLGVKPSFTAALSLKNEMFLIGKKTFQKILLLTYVQDRVFGNIHQAKKLGQMIACEATKPKA